MGKKNINTLKPEGEIESLSMLSGAESSRTARAGADLNGWFAGDVGDQEVHGDVLAVDVLVHHVPDGLGHHVGVQVGVVLQKHKDRGMCE